MMLVAPLLLLAWRKRPAQKPSQPRGRAAPKRKESDCEQEGANKRRHVLMHGMLHANVHNYLQALHLCMCCACCIKTYEIQNCMRVVGLAAHVHA